ncbi:hypothetical protein [Kitasatospora sp. MBT63]|uniref:hypothetical protein n=1 Tax=Kitasatospora sp. MBT63 TaxID=1444768 RepID=UPI00053A1315|nr:hypothetical protein [Kitasatospora sp. MBT63]
MFIAQPEGHRDPDAERPAVGVHEDTQHRRGGILAAADHGAAAGDQVRVPFAIAHDEPGRAPASHRLALVVEELQVQ